MPRFPVPCLIALGLASASAPARAQCPGWDEHFAGANVLRGPAHVAAFDGALLALGQDTEQDGFWRLARFDGVVWRFLPNHVSPSAPKGLVRGSAVHDFGAGPELFVVGVFTPPTHFVGRWDGSQWDMILGPGGSFVGGPFASSIVVHDDGSGSALYVGGRFTTPGNYVARYSSAGWSALGSGLDGTVLALAVHDEGAGPRLFAGGEFQMAGGSPAARIARWDGSGWTAVGGGLPLPVQALASYDAGFGPRLIASTSIGVYAWDGLNWTVTPGDMPGPVASFAIHDLGAGPRLFASNGYGAQRVAASYDGTAWTPVPGNVQGSSSIASVEGQLVLASSTAFDPSGRSISTWNGIAYRALGAGSGFDGRVQAFEVRDEGAGPVVYAGGSMWSAGDVLVRGVARLEGDRWSALGDGLVSAFGNAGVLDLEFFDDGAGAGPRLYASSGALLSTGNRLAYWTGTAWLPSAGSPAGLLDRLKVYDDGQGPRLYVGGFFSFGGGQNFARFDGTTWTAPGAGTDQPIHDLEAFDDGSGARLYAGGGFSLAGGVPALRVARFDGSSWSALGAGLPAVVRDLHVHDAGAGPALHAAAGSAVYRWDGSAWISLGEPDSPHPVSVLVSHDEGGGRRLVAAAGSILASGAGSVRLWAWANPGWVPFADESFNGNLRALASGGTAASPALFVGGDFSRAGAIPSSRVAVRRAASMVETCFGDDRGTPCPCGNASPSAARAGCRNSSGQGATLRGRGCASLASDSVALEAGGLLAGAALFFQGSHLERLGAGAVFGDGLRCVGGTIVRLNSAIPSAGAASYPDASQPLPISVRGGITVAGTTRYYQVWHRDLAAFCTPAAWNLTNALRVEWGA